MNSIVTLEQAAEGSVVTLSPAEFDVLASVPAVTAANASPTRSQRYRHINTGEVVAALREHGFVVDRAHFTKTRKNGTRDPMFAKHQVVMRSTELGDFDGITPEFLVTNSHDGSSSLDLWQGAFRFICGNGIIICNNTFSRERIRHSGKAAAEAIDKAIRMSRSTSKWLKTVDEWKKIDMTTGQRNEFARLASVLRWGDANRFDVQDVLSVRRAEDDHGDLWTTFNRVQENAMKGGFAGLASTGRRATARPLTEIAKSSAFNADLWNLAEEFAEDHGIVMA
ncbi:MAG TPA: DUF932 domain-containing protein [Abditibacteriaceae bacterium]|jgi:hypothetical protein